MLHVKSRCTRQKSALLVGSFWIIKHTTKCGTSETIDMVRVSVTKRKKKTLRFEMKRVRLLIGLQNTWLALCLHARVCHGCLVSYPGILAPMDCLKLARSRHRDDPREPQKFSWKVLEGSGRCVFFLLSTCFLHRK